MFANWEEHNSGVSGEFPIFLEVGTAKAIRKHNRLLPRGKMHHPGALGCALQGVWKKVKSTGFKTC